MSLTASLLLLLLASGAEPLSRAQEAAYAAALPGVAAKDAAPRIAKIRKDQEASKTIETTWTALQDPRLDDV